MANTRVQVFIILALFGASVAIPIRKDEFVGNLPLQDAFNTTASVTGQDCSCQTCVEAILRRGASCRSLRSCVKSQCQDSYRDDYCISDILDSGKGCEGLCDCEAERYGHLGNGHCRGEYVCPASPSPSPGEIWSAAGAKWDFKASNNGDISEALTTGMSWSDSQTVTNSVQTSLAVAVEAEATFFGEGGKVTVTSTISNGWSKAIEHASTRTTSSSCTAECHKSDLPSGSYGWSLYQWTLSGEKNSNVLTTDTCQFLCIPMSYKAPQCPLSCCNDQWCQTCADCFN